MRHQRNTRAARARRTTPANAFASWLSEQGRGALTRLQLATGLSYSLLQKAKRGEGVSLECAAKLSGQTGLPLGVFCHDAPEWIRSVSP